MQVKDKEEMCFPFHIYFVSHITKIISRDFLKPQLASVIET